MKTSKEIRQEFIDFFKSKEHTFVPSSPVVPQDDPTLYFTNAGMNQFKSIFLGDNKDGLKRAANSQKCMRVSGKHNDLEEVGVDHHHHTFFEMLGNWSFGDYYKKEAIAWSWELFTEVWKLPKDKLYATVFEDDDEAEELWKNETDIPHAHISRCDAKDNFWEMGDTGPCGPCSEIHFDTGEGTCIYENDPNHTCGVNADECGRYIELWNNVFMQYNRLPDGSLEELPAKHVDTGMGFERIARVLLDVKSNYDIDVFRTVIDKLEEMSGKKYGFGEEGIPFRVIADHIRALTFSITDGAIPSNKDRGYVVRRILRRAFRFGRKLDLNEPFLYKLVPTLVSTMGEAFPEIAQRQEYVMNAIKAEEESFNNTLEKGLNEINVIIEKCNKENRKVLNGEEVFLLYGTHGFPMDLTRLIASENGLTVDEEGFKVCLEKEKEEGRKNLASDDGLSPDGWVELQSLDGTDFVGYDSLESTVKIGRYKVLQQVDGAEAFETALVILDKTPFYAEMGGQLGDSGILKTRDGFTVNVTDTIKWNDTVVHKLSSEGFPTNRLGEEFSAIVNREDREATKRNHSATHLLQSALIKVLGEHITQSGSAVGPQGLRFDFTHFQAVTVEELTQVEDLVNQWTLENYSVSTEEKNTEEAKKAGATALFGEKYGDTVRVVSMGDVSIELCGGTHASSTGDIGLFHIVAESSIAAGVRRIEAVTGKGALTVLRKKQQVVSGLSDLLKVSEGALLQRVTDMTGKIKTLESEITKLSQEQAGSQVENILKNANSKGLFPFVAINLGSMDKGTFSTVVDTVSDIIKSKGLDTTVAFLSANVGGKALFAASAGKKAVSDHGIHCGNLVKEAAKLAGGGGGGSPVRAQAGGKNPEAIGEALEVITALLKEKASA